MSDHLHAIARERAATLIDPDRKQLRWNEIVACAERFYSSNPHDGVRELVDACDRAKPDLYVAKRPMWKVLNDEYGWMSLKQETGE